MMRSTLRPATWPASLVAWRCASEKYAGVVITASVTGSPRYASASRLSFCSTNALICWAVKVLSSILTVQSVPMWRLTDRMVRSTLVTAWRLATSPTRTSPPLAKATTDGVVREPSALGLTVGSPPSSTATTELVVPRSMPTARAMLLILHVGSVVLESVALNLHLERTRLNYAMASGIPGTGPYFSAQGTLF